MIVELKGLMFTEPKGVNVQWRMVSQVGFSLGLGSTRIPLKSVNVNLSFYSLNISKSVQTECPHKGRLSQQDNDIKCTNQGSYISYSFYSNQMISSK